MDRPRVVVAAHDAGGGEIVSSWVRRHPENVYTVFAPGPSFRIFSAKGIDVRTEIDPEAIRREIARSDWTLCGTGSEFEKSVIEIARGQGKKVVAFLDHWTRYRRRFSFKGPLILPDEIWVGDEDALSLAREQFPDTVTKLVPNPYFADMRDDIAQREIAEVRDQGRINILFLAQPIGNHAEDFRVSGHRSEGASEFILLKEFLSGVEEQVRSAGFELAGIRIRRHPSELLGKYAHIIEQFPDMEVREGGNANLLDDCVWADWVVGFETMAMIVALQTNRRVFTLSNLENRKSIPPLSKVQKWPQRPDESDVLWKTK